VRPYDTASSKRAFERILAALAFRLTGQDKLEFDAASIKPNMSVRIAVVIRR
jgi:hypothetical protein